MDVVNAVMMSAMGQKQTLTTARAMSALPPKADINGCIFDVCFVPKADSCTAANWLFDHLVGNGNNAGRHGETKCFCSS
jgi:hypothetical protein